MRRELNGPMITCQEDLAQIPDLSAREIGRYLLSLNKYLIAYESVWFEHRSPDGTFYGATCPDYDLVELDGGKEIIVEGTRSGRHYPSEFDIPNHILEMGVTKDDLLPAYVKTDPKAKQRHIMSVVAPDTEYIVWGAEELLEIQSQNPGFDFFPDMQNKQPFFVSESASIAA